MAAVTAEDIKYIACDSGKVTAEQLAPALNAAAATRRHSTRTAWTPGTA
ncbi:MAG: hypothetical protein ACLUEK_07475 [Oscillospiraceae bacterium]